MKKFKSNLPTVIMSIIIVLFLVYFVSININKTKEIEMESDITYESLLGSIEEVPNVERWIIERDKYIGKNYTHMSWELRITYDDGTSVQFGDRESISQLFDDLENLNEAKLYTSSKMDKE